MHSFIFLCRTINWHYVILKINWFGRTKIRIKFNQSNQRAPSQCSIENEIVDAMNTENCTNGSTETVATRTDHTNCNGDDTSAVDNDITSAVTEVINNVAQDDNVDNYDPQGDPVVSIQINGDAVTNSPLRFHHRRHRLDSESIDIQGDTDDDGSDTANGDDDENQHLDVPSYNADDNALEVATTNSKPTLNWGFLC